MSICGQFLPWLKNETQTFSWPQCNSLQGIHRCLARSADAVFLFFSAVDRDDRVRLCIGQRRETYGDACSQRGSHRREPSVDRPFCKHGVVSCSGRGAELGATQERNAQRPRLRRARYTAELYSRTVGGPLCSGAIACRWLQFHDSITGSSDRARRGVDAITGIAFA